MSIRHQQQGAPRLRAQQGSALIEFMFCVSLLWIPLFCGTFLFGFNLIRVIQVTQVCRDAGHMYAFGTDFTQTSSRQLLVGLAPGLNMTATGGNGVVVLSTLTYADASLCTAANLQADSSHCPNINKIVITRRQIVGASSLHTSAFASPAPGIIGASGKIAASDYLTNASAVAQGFSSVLNMQSSTQLAFVSEMWVTSPDMNFWSAFSPLTIAARSIF